MAGTSGANGTEQTGLAIAEHDESNAEVSSLVRLAIDRGVDVEVLERLVALQERVTERDAELALAEALAAFQAECPPVPTDRRAKVTKNGVLKYEYPYASLQKIVRVIGPFLAKHGLTYRHDGDFTDGQIRTTCTVQHIAGASRTATFTGPTDQSGGKNPIQQVASARSYGRRYTLIDALGLTTEEDDDGAAAGGSESSTDKITEAQAADLESLADEVKADKPKFLKYMGAESFSDICVSDYQRAVRALEGRRK